MFLVRKQKRKPLMIEPVVASFVILLGHRGMPSTAAAAAADRGFIRSWIGKDWPAASQATLLVRQCCRLGLQ